MLQESIHKVPSLSGEACQDLRGGDGGESSRSVTTGEIAKALLKTSLETQPRRTNGIDRERDQRNYHAKSTGSVGGKLSSITRSSFCPAKVKGKIIHRGGKSKSINRSYNADSRPVRDPSTVYEGGVWNFGRRSDGRDRAAVQSVGGIIPNGKYETYGACDDLIGSCARRPSELNSSFGGGWGQWKRVCKTRHATNTVELPQGPVPGHGSLVVGLKYRVGVRRREDRKRFIFRCADHVSSSPHLVSTLCGDS